MSESKQQPSARQELDETGTSALSNLEDRVGGEAFDAASSNDSAEAHSWPVEGRDTQHRGLTTAQLEQLRDRLRQKEAELLRATESLSKEQKPEFDSSPHEASQQRTMSASLLANQRSQLQLVWGALLKLRNGQLGRCAKCRRDISFERLIASPATTLCRACYDEG